MSRQEKDGASPCALGVLVLRWCQCPVPESVWELRMPLSIEISRRGESKVTAREVLKKM